MVRWPVHLLGLEKSPIAGARRGKGDIIGTRVKSRVWVASTQALVLDELGAGLSRTGLAGESLIASMPSRYLGWGYR